MSNNLGWYKKTTTFMKSVGGPKNFYALLLCSGYVILRPFEALIKAGAKKWKKKRTSKDKLEQDIDLIFNVTSDGEDGKELKMNIGDKYRILESDGESILIEKLGDLNNPYFVSAEFLRSISDFTE